MDSGFSKVYRELRQAAGFQTAYRFYHKSGGARMLGCSFQSYLRIEKGTHLPAPRRLPLLATLLRLPQGSAELKRLVRAYLETWLGSGDLADWMLAPFAASRPDEAPPDPASRALAKVTRDTARPLSLDQYKAIMSRPGAYWCYRVLTSSDDAHSASDLSRLLGLAAAEVQGGLEALRRARIAERARDGRWRSPLAGQFLIFPDSRLIPKELMDRVFRFNEAMIARKGGLWDVRYCGVRADARELEGYVPHLRESIRAVNAYSTTRKTDRSGLFFVESRIYKLFDF